MTYRQITRYGSHGGDPRIADRLTPDAVLFRYPDGAAYRWRHVTAFSALDDLIKGRTEQLRTFAQWTRDVGGNGWRVFGNWSRLGLDASVTPMYLGWLEALCRVTRAERLRLQFVAICDYLPSALAPAVFLEDCARVLRSYPHVFLSVANEPYKNLAGGSDAAQTIPLPSGVLCDRGAAGDIALMPNGAAHTVYHTPRDDEWYRKGKDLYEIRTGSPGTHGPVEDDEPIGAAEVAISGRRDNNPDRFAWGGATRAQFGSGATFHGDSNTLQLCTVPGPTEDACARAFFAAMDAVPLEAANWRYGRYGEGAPATPHVIADDPGAVRVYEMSSDRAAVVVVCQPSTAWAGPVPVNGWRVVQTDGPRESIVVCEK